MFWIYGGSLISGTIFMPYYNGSVLATNDVVLVATNYRLGSLGFMFGGREDAPGNVGFYDQLLALKWVRDNIHAFGGDRDQITIFGQSAGSWSVSAHIVSPLSKGLFKRAIMESGAHMYYKERDVINTTEAILNGQHLAEQLKCNTTEQWLQCLRGVDAKEFIKIVSFLTFPVEGTEFLPISYKKAFETKKFNSDIDLIAGMTSDEDSGKISQIFPDVHNLTVEGFKFLMSTVNQIYHGLDAENVTQFYLKNIDPKDPGAIVQAYEVFLVRGLTVNALNTSVDQFLNIPYAEPPVGSLRFAKPVPLKEPIKEIIDGTETGNSCYQTVNELYKDFIGNLTLSEDCLVLNVWTPHVRSNTSSKDLPLKPVMFWIHGGGLVIGSSFQYQYNGSALAAHDVVVVSMNYRLGQFGFLYGGDDRAPGNQGFYDQLLALKWVSENIHKFGGDRDQITIFGESAGSWSVSVQILSPLSKGLFKRAIMESGAHMFNKDRDIRTKSEVLGDAKNLAKHFNCSENEWLECLQKVDANDLKEVIMAATMATIDTEYLPVSAHTAFETLKFNKDLDLMAGVAAHEGSLLLYSVLQHIPQNITESEFKKLAQSFDSLFHDLNATAITDFYLDNVNKTDPEQVKWALYDLYGDLIMTCPTYQFAKNYATHSGAGSVYFYEITYTRSNKQDPQYDVSHGADLDFVFG
ncbi:unnamed protein product [Oppiella nova]|uniref:Carboxylic ester hydrolase n=1 Tax=Oppiella nova TaxID=334625 RepID=A0A7R9LSW1_9ACAR|nr:unnamed protein product [Oppiella nova]CAG2166663.1 unnamed protein product [Oppiella nova]